MRKFKNNTPKTAQISPVALLPSAISHVYLKPHLYEFLCIREKLSTQDPILHLERRTLISKALHSFCKKPDTLITSNTRALDRKVYSVRLKFVPLENDIEQLNYLLDEQGIRRFNEFLHDLMIEFLSDYVTAFIEDKKTASEIKTAKSAIEKFIIHYNLQDTEFEVEALKKAEYRLREKRGYVSEK